MKLVLSAALVLAAPAALAQGTAQPQPITVTMTDTGFVPRRIVLRQGAPYVLHVVNRTDKGHNLSQPAFFRSARVDRADRPLTGSGKIVLGAHERATVHFDAPTTRAGGTYEFRSTTLADSDNDYKGVFVIR